MVLRIIRGIGKEKIFAAAAEIVAAGGVPTLAAVRAALGGGSYTTISEALKEWRAGQTVTPDQPPAPQTLHDQLAGVIGSVWSTALELANARLNSERAALEHVRVDMEQSNADAMAMADHLTCELDQARLTIERQNRELENLRVAVQAEQARLESAVREIEAAKSAVAEARADARTAGDAAAELRGVVATLREQLAATKGSSQGPQPDAIKRPGNRRL